MRDRKRLRLRLQWSGRRLPVGGAIGFNSPTCLPSECGDNVIHISACREGEISVLPETGEHSAGDGSPVPFSKFRSLLFLFSLFPAFYWRGWVVVAGVCGGKAAKAALGLGLRVVWLGGGGGGRRLRLRRRLLGIEIPCRDGEAVVHGVCVGVHSCCISHSLALLCSLSLSLKRVCAKRIVRTDYGGWREQQPSHGGRGLQRF